MQLAIWAAARGTIYRGAADEANAFHEEVIENIQITRRLRAVKARHTCSESCGKIAASLIASASCTIKSS